MLLTLFAAFVPVTVVFKHQQQQHEEDSIMGFYQSRNRNVENGESTVPRYASVYHGWMGYIGFFIQLFLGVSIFTMLIGQWQSSATVTLLSFVVIVEVVYLVFMVLNSVWYGVTFARRRYFTITTEDADEVRRITLNGATYDKITERDLKFHSDQRHFSVAAVVYFFILIFLAVFLGLSSTANPSPDYNTPPAAYTATANSNFIIIKFFQALVLIAAGGFTFLLLDTLPCFMHSTLIGINRSLNGADGRGPTPAEYPEQPAQVGSNNTILAKQTGIAMASKMNKQQGVIGKAYM